MDTVFIFLLPTLPGEKGWLGMDGRKLRVSTFICLKQYIFTLPYINKSLH